MDNPNQEYFDYLNALRDRGFIGVELSPVYFPASGTRYAIDWKKCGT